MTVARLDREMSSRELSWWKSYYRIIDDAKAGRRPSGEGEERGDLSPQE